MKTKSFQEVERFVEDALEEFDRISATKNKITQVRDRFIRGAATREEVFLALNDASTNMTIFKSLYLQASKASCYGQCFNMEESKYKCLLDKFDAKKEELLYQEKKPTRNLTVINGSKPEKDDATNRQLIRTTPRH